MESNRRNWLVPPDINALRAVSDRPMKTRWEPVDLACGHLREEVTVRTKLARSDESMAVCIAEAVSHALLLANGFRMAEPFCVVIGEQFAQDLTTQYRFAEPVRPGRHWGTRLMRRGVQEVELTASLVEVLARISHTVTAEGRWGSVGAEFLPRGQVEQEQAALRPCFREARVAGTAA